MLHPTKVLQITFKSWVGWLRKQTNFDRKSVEKLDGKPDRIFDVFLEVVGVIFGGP